MKNYWERMYREKNVLEVIAPKNQLAASLVLIGKSNLKLDDPVLDVGGGGSPFADYLLKAGHTRLGVLDISGDALLYTQMRLGERAKQVQLFQADVLTFTAPCKFQVWHDRAVFRSLATSGDRHRYLSALKNNLLPGGVVIVGAFAPDNPSDGSKDALLQYDAERIRKEFGAGFGLLQEIPEMHIVGRNPPRRFNCFQFVFFGG
jgi:SAM-dependent methyltransferase